MTELIWDGKYDDKGRKVAPPRIALPFQTVETVNESAADRDRNQDLFASGRQLERSSGATSRREVHLTAFRVESPKRQRSTDELRRATPAGRQRCSPLHSRLVP